MAGTTLDRKLTTSPAGRVPFALAMQSDDADIRRLLRENPMPGRIALTLEREPNYFADADSPGTQKQTIIASEGGRVVCVGSCAIRQRFVNGQSLSVGYLGGLRLDAPVAGRFDILRRGYKFFRELQADRPADFYFTSIAADNAAARKFLERGLPEMPSYEFVGEFVTVVLPTKVQLPVQIEPEASMPDFSELLSRQNKHGRNYQFAPCWSEHELSVLRTLNLRSGDFYVMRNNGSISGSAALWDQRPFKQTVIQSYASWLAMTRPALNFASVIIGTPRLPAVGSVLAHAFMSHVAVEPQDSDAFIALTARLRTLAARRGIEFLTLGLASCDPRLILLRRQFRFREYLSRIYVVRWPGLGGSARELDGRWLGPEVALL
jgi:hypothetical protein